MTDHAPTWRMLIIRTDNWICLLGPNTIRMGVGRATKHDEILTLMLNPKAWVVLNDVN